MKAEPGYPDFLFVGTAKAGTTSLYHHLKKHPQVCLPLKETFFFADRIFRDNHMPFPYQRPKDEMILEEEKYRSVYSNCNGKVTGEIGTGYLYYHDIAIPKIKEYLGDQVKVGIVLRNPVDRAYSAYMHHRKDLHETSSLAAVWNKEEERIRDNWDFMWYYREVGFYHDQVKAYLDNFENVQVFYFDDLRNDPDSFMGSVCDFLEIDPLSDWSADRKYNPSGVPRLAFLQRAITQEGPVKQLFRPVVRKLFSKEKRKRMRKFIKNKNLRSQEKMTEKDRRMLIEAYREDVVKLEVLLNKDLAHWLVPV